MVPEQVGKAVNAMDHRTEAARAATPHVSHFPHILLHIWKVILLDTRQLGWCPQDKAGQGYYSTHCVASIPPTQCKLERKEVEEKTTADANNSYIVPSLP